MCRVQVIDIILLYLLKKKIISIIYPKKKSYVYDFHTNISLQKKRAIAAFEKRSYRP